MGNRAAVNVVLQGEEFRWELGLLWLESNRGSGTDGEWIDAEVQLSINFAGEFLARRETDVLTTELRDFQRDLDALVSTKTGTASFTMLEAETGLTITADVERPGVYDVDVFVLCHAGPELRATELDASQRGLEALLHSLGEATALFPVRDQEEAGS